MLASLSHIQPRNPDIVTNKKEAFGSYEMEDKGMQYGRRKMQSLKGI
jgi:hypothetical protein